jgi:TonB family protein
MIAALLLCVLTQTTTASPATAVRIDGNAAPPTRIAGALPVYPDEARQRRIGGVVTIDVTIDTKGKVTGATMLRSIPALAAAAADAVHRWEYRITPPMVNGAPAPALVTVVFYFDADTGRVDEMHRVPSLGPQPKKTKTVPPVYPASQQAGRTGQVVIEAVVNRAGQVIDTRVVRGTRGFESAARDAVRQWEYAPLVIDGAVVPFVVTVTVVISPR